MALAKKIYPDLNIIRIDSLGRYGSDEYFKKSAVMVNDINYHNELALKRRNDLSEEELQKIEMTNKIGKGDKQ